MRPKEIYNVLMQEFAGFHKTSVDVRYRPILGVNNGASTGATPDGSDHVLSLIIISAIPIPHHSLFPDQFATFSPCKRWRTVVQYNCRMAKGSGACCDPINGVMNRTFPR